MFSEVQCDTIMTHLNDMFDDMLTMTCFRHNSYAAVFRIIKE